LQILHHTSKEQGARKIRRGGREYWDVKKSTYVPREQKKAVHQIDKPNFSTPISHPTQNQSLDETKRGISLGYLLLSSLLPFSLPPFILLFFLSFLFFIFLSPFSFSFLFSFSLPRFLSSPSPFFLLLFLLKKE